MTTDGPTTPAIEWVVTTIAGDVDLGSAPALRQQLAEASDVAPAHLVLDLTALTFIDSTGLGVLVGTLRRIRASGGELRVAGPRPSVARVFEVTGLDRVFEVFPSVTAATEAPLPE